ncbi:MAG: hypothetical protein AMJ41_01390 [candidate division Zixibacteria bacterium DG_27]|nr:MAG: hypothetical protein AMJ41_01390 [candidate division Zixibacteria bacterium DG_27]
MKKDSIFLIAVFLYLVATGFYFWKVVKPQPEIIRNLDYEIRIKSEKLLSAQILAENLSGVTDLLRSNFASSLADSTAQTASIPFLSLLTEQMEVLGITLVSLRPEELRQEAQILKIPYEINMLATYEQLGQFLALLERSSRLIEVGEFTIHNRLGTGRQFDIAGKPDQHEMSLRLNVLTLLKRGSEVETRAH